MLWVWIRKPFLAEATAGIFSCHNLLRRMASYRRRLVTLREKTRLCKNDPPRARAGLPPCPPRSDGTRNYRAAFLGALKQKPHQSRRPRDEVLFLVRKLMLHPLSVAGGSGRTGSYLGLFKACLIQGNFQQHLYKVCKSKGLGISGPLYFRELAGKPSDN